MTIQTLNQEKLENLKDKTIIIKFTAKWCGPCKQLAPIYEEVSKEIELEFYEVDIDKEQELAQKFEVMSVPTIVVLKQNKEILRINGYMPKTTLKEKINSQLK